SGRDAAVRFEFPFFGARGEFECMNMVIVAAKIHRVGRNDRGRENLSSAMKQPFDLVKLRYPRRFVNASMLRTGAERRNVLRENGRAYNQYRKSDDTTMHGDLR